jgi:hypothetical protein
MALSEKLLMRQALQRSAREWLKIYREVLQEASPHGLGYDGSPKSSYSPVTANSVASGRILQAGYEITKEDNGEYEVTFGLPGYIMAIDQGVKPSTKYGNKPSTGRRGGKSQFIKSLMDWIKTKRIESDETKTKSLAFAIRTKILNDGIEAKNVLSEINRRFDEKFAAEIETEFMISMENYIIDNITRIEDRFR